ncbi:predicted protein [Uncinocarpus reesii 1704]|uniref:Uncharacterized protein n=1 Tax=Uncinocarpus reesii (strain UAMH 1704) TaxID=336963 RepID=C4JLF7_UNCRE|nr:uncharacterized protein UREG_03665 [Uncinocarpus reesii 1704]EEP78819.1 predicted protein [Uncinocarpus reesii 1704]
MSGVEEQRDDGEGCKSWSVRVKVQSRLRWSGGDARVARSGQARPDHVGALSAGQGQQGEDDWDWELSDSRNRGGNSTLDTRRTLFANNSHVMASDPTNQANQAPPGVEFLRFVGGDVEASGCLVSSITSCHPAQQLIPQIETKTEKRKGSEGDAHAPHPGLPSRQESRQEAILHRRSTAAFWAKSASWIDSSPMPPQIGSKLDVIKDKALPSATLESTHHSISV